MKIGLFSDLHLGFGSGTERENDAFDNLREAIEICKDCDLILIAGDIFDNKTPSTETLAKSMETLLSAFSTKTKTKIAEGMNKDIDKILKFGYGIPIIAIHGNHERRSKGLLNPVEALEKAGFLAHLHGNGMVVGNELKIAIQGIGGVPDQVAEKVFNEWYPRPKDGCYNILLMHQSFEGFVYSEHAVPKDDIPRGFDLYINGHVHDPSETVYDGKPFIHPGGMVITQVTGNTKPVRVYKINIEKTENSFNAEISFEELPNQRKVYNMESDSIVDIGVKMKEILDSGNGKKPLIRIKTKALTDELKIKYGEKALLSFSSPKEEKIVGVSIEDHKLSVDEFGKKLLRENMEKEGLDAVFFENIFELLAEKQSEKVVEMLEK